MVAAYRDLLAFQFVVILVHKDNVENSGGIYLCKAGHNKAVKCVGRVKRYVYNAVLYAGCRADPPTGAVGAVSRLYAKPRVGICLSVCCNTKESCKQRY